MVVEILCEARQQIRSIVGLCEEFDIRRSRAKVTHQNDFFISSPSINLESQSTTTPPWLALVLVLV